MNGTERHGETWIRDPKNYQDSLSERMHKIDFRTNGFRQRNPPSNFLACLLNALYKIYAINRHPFLGEGRTVVAYAWKTKQMLNHVLSVPIVRLPTSVISNLTRPIDSLSPMAKYEERGKCPTIEAHVSLCWWVNQSLFNTIVRDGQGRLV